MSLSGERAAALRMATEAVEAFVDNFEFDLKVVKEGDGSFRVYIIMPDCQPIRVGDRWRPAGGNIRHDGPV